eukprot:366381-Chlamydomonas_euryale.AAC.5
MDQTGLAPLYPTARTTISRKGEGKRRNGRKGGRQGGDQDEEGERRESRGRGAGKEDKAIPCLAIDASQRCQHGCICSTPLLRAKVE